MSVWLFMFSWQSLSLCATLNPQLTLKFIKCSKREKKKKHLPFSSPQKCSVFSVIHVYITLITSQLSNGFRNMVAFPSTINLAFPSTIVRQYWPGVVSGTSSHPLLYQKSWMLKSFMENDRSNGSMFG